MVPAAAAATAAAVTGAAAAVAAMAAAAAAVVAAAGAVAAAKRLTPPSEATPPVAPPPLHPRPAAARARLRRSYRQRTPVWPTRPPAPLPGERCRRRRLRGGLAACPLPVTCSTPPVRHVPLLTWGARR